MTPTHLCLTKSLQCEKLCTRGNLKLYKMRALKKVWEAKSGGGEEEGGAEEETN